MLNPVPETLPERYDRVAARQRELMIVSADDFRVNEFGIYSHEGDMGIIAWRMAEQSFSELLPLADRVVALAGAPGAGKTTWVNRSGLESGVLYLDATLARRLTRRRVCELASAAGKEISCVLIHPRVEVCLARNQSRGRHVPEDQLRRAHHRLTVCPPATDEGWSEVVVIGDGLDADSGRVDDGLDSSGSAL
jgi:predicted kinase